jgi:hypothetical protein
MLWEKSDSSRFRDYHAKTGGKLISYLRSLVPITQGVTIEQVALEAKYKEGAEYIISHLTDMLSDENNDGDASSASFIAM